LPIELGGFTLGALVQSNFGSPRNLIIAGTPIGQILQPPDRVDARYLPSDMTATHDDKGSIMIVLATDAPLDVRQLQRLCARAGAGLARVGSHFEHGSGDFVVGFSTANRIEHEPIRLVGTRAVLIDEARVIEELFRAVVESVEEAIVNSLFGAETMTGRDDHVAWALPISEVLALASFATNSRRRETP
jgi:D-aminopeptidase